MSWPGRPAAGQHSSIGRHGLDDAEGILVLRAACWIYNSVLVVVVRDNFRALLEQLDAACPVPPTARRCK